jgi:hypothetical protein
MHNLIKVEDHDNLRRDPRNNAIVDVDSEAYAQYMQSKQRRQQQQDRLQNLENKINNFENDLSSIKHLLQQLLETQHGHHS